MSRPYSNIIYPNPNQPASTFASLPIPIKTLANVAKDENCLRKTKNVAKVAQHPEPGCEASCKEGREGREMLAKDIIACERRQAGWP
jgi:hypothetical protein